MEISITTGNNCCGGQLQTEWWWIGVIVIPGIETVICNRYS